MGTKECYIFSAILPYTISPHPSYNPRGCTSFSPSIPTHPPPPPPFAQQQASVLHCAGVRGALLGSLSRDKWLFCDNRMSLIKLVINRITRRGVCRALTEMYKWRPSIKNSCLGCNSYVSEATNNNHNTSPLLIVDCESFKVPLKYLQSWKLETVLKT